MLLNKTRMPFRIVSAITLIVVALATISGCVNTTTTDIVIIEDVTVTIEDNEID
jgi:hypothetical protein